MVRRPRVSSIALAVLVAPVWTAAAFGATPAPAPRAFATENYFLAFRIPAGLFRCPYPPGWVGPDHGVVMYLAKPRACDASGPVAAEPEEDRPPSIDVFYAYNLGEIATPGREPHVPETNAELMRSECHARARLWPEAPRFLGRRARGCMRVQGRSATLTIGGLYNFAPHADGRMPDGLAQLTLRTSVARLKRDLGPFWAIAGSVRPCTQDGGTHGNGWPHCPPWHQW